MNILLMATVFLTVTNHAGHVVSGEYVRSTKSHFFLKLTPTTTPTPSTFNLQPSTSSITRAFAYSAFPKAERDRIKLLTGNYEQPAFVRELERDHAEALKRIDLLVESGDLSSAEAEAKRREHEAARKKAIDRLVKCGRLSQTEADHLLVRGLTGR